MKKTIVYMLVLVALLLPVSAKGIDMFGENTPMKYLPKQTAIVKNPASPCNTGEEPFSVFIKKFNTDAAFRAERTKVHWTSVFYDDSTERAQEHLKSFSKTEVLTEYSALPVAPQPLTRKRGVTMFKTYFVVGKDRVGFYVTSEGSEFGSGATLGFIRDNGKWYLTYVQICG